jgi:hypothetical protein
MRRADGADGVASNSSLLRAYDTIDYTDVGDAFKTFLRDRSVSVREGGGADGANDSTGSRNEVKLDAFFNLHSKAMQHGADAGGGGEGGGQSRLFGLVGRPKFRDQRIGDTK